MYHVKLQVADHWENRLLISKETFINFNNKSSIMSRFMQMLQLSSTTCTGGRHQAHDLLSW